ncbi:MAG: hypothetical protein JXQ26_07080 [Tissierellales bacterium]|nr:hypothetical protein [Tissierellales bacterium]
MLQTYVFHIGQYIAIRKISKNYPTLKVEATELQNLWKMKFGAAVENLAAELRYNIGDKLGDYETEIIIELSLTDDSLMTLNDAQNALLKFESRVNGDIPSPFLETLLSFHPKYINNPEAEFNDDFVGEYLSSESEKSDGINIKFKYPKSWKHEEGDRPHVIQKFTSNNGLGLEMALLMIEKVDTTMTESDIDLLLSESFLKYQLPDSAKMLSYETGLTLSGIKASSITYYQIIPQMQFIVATITKSYFLFYKNYKVSVIFAVGAEKGRESDLSSRYEKFYPLFWKMANYLTIMSRYE